MGISCENSNRIIFGELVKTPEDRLRIFEWMVDQEKNGPYKTFTRIYDKLFSPDFSKPLIRRLIYLTDYQARVLRRVGFLGNLSQTENFTVSNCGVYEKLFRGETLSFYLLDMMTGDMRQDLHLVAINRDKEGSKVSHWMLGWVELEELQRFSQ